MYRVHYESYQEKDIRMLMYSFIQFLIQRMNIKNMKNK